MAGVPTPRCRAWATVIDPAPRARAQPSEPGRSCRAFIACSGTSRVGWSAPTTASVTTTSRPTWTSSPSASTGGAPRWRPSRPCSASPRAFMDLRRTTGCTLRSQPDKHKGLYVSYAPPAFHESHGTSSASSPRVSRRRVRRQRRVTQLRPAGRPPRSSSPPSRSLERSTTSSGR